MREQVLPLEMYLSLISKFLLSFPKIKKSTVPFPPICDNWVYTICLPRLGGLSKDGACGVVGQNHELQGGPHQGIPHTCKADQKKFIGVRDNRKVGTELLTPS